MRLNLVGIRGSGIAKVLAVERKVCILGFSGCHFGSVVSPQAERMVMSEETDLR